MDIRRLAYFHSVAENLSFTKAANQHHIAQTSMSRYIIAMEEELGFQLFYRDNHSVALTPAGKSFYLETKALAEEYNKAVARAQKAVYGTQSIRIGFGPHERNLVSNAVRSFRKDNPDVYFNVSEQDYPNLANGLERGSYDVIFSTLRWPKDLPDCEYKVVAESPNVMILAKDHPLVTCGKPVTAEDLSRLPMIINLDQVQPSDFNTYMKSFEVLGFIPDHLEFVNSFNAKLILVESTEMLGAIPGFMKAEYQDRFHILQLDTPPVSYCAAILKSTQNSTAAQFFEHIPPAML